jgi:hypothetical protein
MYLTRFPLLIWREFWWNPQIEVESVGEWWDFDSVLARTSHNANAAFFVDEIRF